MSKTYLQIAAPFDRHAFHGCAAALLLQCETVRDNLPETYEELWKKDTRAFVTWLEVPALETAFICFIGSGTEEEQGSLSKLLSGNRVEDLISRAPELPHDELLLRFYWVAYMTEHPSQLVLEFFDSGMRDPRKNIRMSTLNGYMIRRWPEWRGRVESAATSDPEDEVRSLARTILEMHSS